MSLPLRKLKDLKLSGQRVFLRLDLNVPLSDPDAEGHRVVTDDNRITEALPTIRYIQEQGGKIIMASHLGRPDGKRSPQFSMEPVAAKLAELLNDDITLADDCIGEGIQMMVNSLKSGQFMLLENLRFHAGEESNDPKFCRELASLADIYVNDAFGTAHRKHASTYGVAQLVQNKAAGFLIEKEVQVLDRLLNAPSSPFYTVLGGSKISDKIKTVESLLRMVDGLLIGGAMAFSFMAARGEKLPTGAKAPSPEDVQCAKSVLREAARREIPVVLPVDFAQSFDIGGQSVALFSRFLQNAKTIFWNGPLGWFEKTEYARGTFEIARILSEVDAFKVVGGGDTVAAIKQSGYAEKFDHLSTGGGAVLEYLEGRGLPGIDVLREFPNQKKDTVLN